MRQRIAIIDDSRAKRTALTYILRDEFDISGYSSGQEALPELLARPPDLILLDIQMPGEDGFAVIQRLKSYPELMDIPVIFLTGMDGRDIEATGLELGAVDFISKEFVPETILARVRVHLELREYRKSLEKIIREKTRMVEHLQDSIVLSLCDLVECRDAATFGHVNRTVRYTEALGQALLDRGVYADQLGPEVLRDFMRAAPLHDIGKVGINDAILNKPARLTNEEYLIMQRHTVLGGRAIQRAIDSIQAPSFLDVVKDMTLFHHERWDGKGYPLGKRGEQIPLCARIVAIADVYDALISERPYKKPLSHDEAVTIIAEGRGKQFDPNIVDVFLQIHEQFAAIASDPAV